MKRLFVIMLALALGTAMSSCAQSNGNSAGSGASESESSVAAADSSASSASSDDESYELPETVFGTPERVISKNGSGQMIGLCAMFYASSEECTEENISSWFDEYVRFSAEDWCVVLYDDKPGYGIHATNDQVDVNVELEENSDGTYSESDDSEADFYVFSKDKQKLVKVE